MGGYTMNIAETERAATALGNDATFARNATDSLTHMKIPGAPAAGEGIGSTLPAFQSGWKEVLNKIGTELSAMSTKVDKTKDVTVTVEVENRGRFGAFAR